MADADEPHTPVPTSDSTSGGLHPLAAELIARHDRQCALTATALSKRPADWPATQVATSASQEPTPGKKPSAQAMQRRYRDTRDTEAPCYCCIVSSVDANGDAIGWPCPCCYVGLCGPVTGGTEYACCCGCTLPTRFPPSRPICELPCPVTCLVWPLLWPAAYCLSHLMGGKVVYAGECCFNGCQCAGCECAGPSYDRDDWYDEDPSCTECVCCGGR